MLDFVILRRAYDARGSQEAVGHERLEPRGRDERPCIKDQLANTTVRVVFNTCRKVPVGE